MTSYEQFVEVAGFIKAQVVAVPVFMMGEKIGIPAPYIVVKSFGIANVHCGKARTDTRGYNILCYGNNRGRTESLVSDILDDFTGVATQSRLELENFEFIGAINILEDNLYEAVISFRVASVFSK